jgi:hypothetical protein
MPGFDEGKNEQTIGRDTVAWLTAMLEEGRYDIAYDIIEFPISTLL